MRRWALWPSHLRAIAMLKQQREELLREIKAECLGPDDVRGVVVRFDGDCFTEVKTEPVEKN